MSVRDFELQLDREWLAVQDDAREAVVIIATRGLAGVIEKSPIKTGQFQNNWLASIGELDGRTIDFPGTFAGISATVIQSYLSTEGFPVINLQNNLPYAGRLEDGYSNQAPAGMVGLTAAELNAQFDGTEI